jgi:hypothetical protein
VDQVDDQGEAGLYCFSVGVDLDNPGRVVGLFIGLYQI